MNRFIMLCGLPCSGKSRFAKEHCNENTKIIDTEVMMSISDEKHRTDDVRELVNKYLNDGFDVILDDTNINSKKRISFLRSIDVKNCRKECIVFAVPYETCVEWDSKRENSVGETAITNKYTKWSTPYFYEGWDSISLLYPSDSRKAYGKTEDYIRKYMDYSQDSKYHAESLGTHLRTTGDYIKNRGHLSENDNLVLAGYIHDCGKPFTKEFKDSKGNATIDAHYYNHQHVGAYDSFFYDHGDITDEDMLEISCIISLHMSPATWTEENTRNKYRKLLGEKLYGRLMLFKEADEACSIRLDNQ